MKGVHCKMGVHCEKGGGVHCEKKSLDIQPSSHAISVIIITDTNTYIVSF